jgi:chemotaxis protein CheD
MSDDIKKIPIRRTDTEKVQVGDVYDGIRRYYDQNLEMTVVKLMTGDCYFTSEAREMLVTILGSCISVCLRDPVTKIGGMNHILLPGDKDDKLAKGDPGYSARFGINAMEELINGMLKLGARKDRFEAKIFGGGNVIKSSNLIGNKNIKFVKEFLAAEHIPIKAEDVGGETPRRLHFFPETGKAMLRKLQRKEDMVILEKEKEYQEKIIHKAEEKPEAEVELF